MRLSGLASAAVLAATGFCVVATAAVPCLAQVPAASVPPDVVKTKDGSMYRGTILELVAGDHVVLQTPSGETKRFPMAEVASVNSGVATSPVDTSAQRAPPPPNEARVHFVSATPGADLYIRTGEATVSGYVWGRYPGLYSGVVQQYQRVCASPCDTTLPAGPQRLALGYEGRSPVETGEAVAVEGPTSLKGTYVDRQGARVAGWVILGLSLAAGTAMLTVAAIQAAPQPCNGSGTEFSCPGPQPANGGLIGAGVATALIGTIVSLVLVLQHDSATIDVGPLTEGLGPVTWRREADARVGPFELSGPGLTARL
jgi:hypothetical protein